MNNYDWLISRLDAFIRKFYANQVIRGGLIFLTCVLGYILLVSLGEYYLYLPVWMRVAIVSAFALLGFSALVIWVIIPLSKMARLGKLISHEQAAGIIGRHFPEVSDKLLNILQLKKQAGENLTSRELIAASINQKASQISVVPITTAIDFSKNKKYLPFLLPVVLVGIFILVAAPNVFREASARLLQPTRTFEKPAPFQFVVSNTSMQAVRNADFTLKVSVKGNALPADMWVDIKGEQVSMQRDGQHGFTYTFKNITEPIQFRLFAAGYYSKSYTIQVAQKPVLKTFKVQIDYPDYTGRKDEVRNSLGDMTLPQGTRLVWAFMAEHTDAAAIRMGEGSATSLLRNGSMFGYQFRFMNDTAYTFILQNKKSAVTESFSYHVKVIADQSPIIQLQQFKDSVSGKQVLLNGTAGDDYGINRVLFHYTITNGQNQTVGSKSIPLSINPGALTTFQHYFDIQTLNLQQGQKLSYFIEAWDNDGVHGSKATRSEVMTFHMYDANQLDSAIQENSQLINSGLSNSSQQTQKLQEEYRDMQSQMLQSDQMDWQNQQNLQELVQKQQQLQAQMEATKKRFEEQIQQSQQKPYSEDLREKQDELRKQMDNLLNKELQEQMKKLQELMQQLNKQQAVQTMQQLEQQNKLFNMDLKRMQELMQKMEMQMRMEDLANKMEDLAKQETRLQLETERNGKPNEQLANEQQQIKKQLDSAMQQEMKQLEELNKKMEQPQELSDPKKSGENAQQQMQQSQQQLNQNQNSKAGQSQNSAAQNLQDMANSLRNSAGGMSQQQIEIDIRAVRQLLTNLMRLSFDQEQLMKGVNTTSPASPQYLTNQQEQNRLYGNSRMIRDSLYVLSRRIFKLAATVNKETADLENNMGRAVKSLEDRNIQDAATRQQYVMMHTNNLALMLNEMLSNLMQMQSQAQSQQQGNCQKPGGAGAPKAGQGQQLSDIITQQQQLGNSMQQMQSAQQRKQGQQGQQPGQQGQQGQQGQPKSGEGGQPGGQGEYGSAEQLAQMAQHQAAIRRQLQELSSLLNSKGLGNPQQLRDIQQQMDKIETDLVNRRLSSDLIARQKEILTRLLQAEKSLREQEEDNKRSAKTPQEISRPIPPELQKYMQERQQMLDVYRTIPPQLKPYYRTMVSQYFQIIGSQ